MYSLNITQVKLRDIASSIYKNNDVILKGSYVEYENYARSIVGQRQHSGVSL